MSIIRWIQAHSRALLIALLLVLIPLTVITLRGTWAILRFDVDEPRRAAVIYDANGRTLATVGAQGSFVSYAEFPDHLVNAVVAIEDSRFWRHRGIDIIGIGRAVLANVRAGGRVQGGSTITQQVARTLFLSREKTFLRKIQEAVYAMLLEIRFSKAEILELYLNRSYFGEGAYGIGEAARVYYDKDTSQLTLAESAMLAGVLQAPSVLSPYRNPERAVDRRNLVLARMHELDMISEEERSAAASEPPSLSRPEGGQAPYFVDYVRSWLVDMFGADMALNGSLRVWTTLRPDIQAAAEEALGEHQGAIVALDPASGAILAMVGGRDYAESQFNRATGALRQPGSALKPHIYAAALERGWQMNDLVSDVPHTFGDYAPKNFRDEYWGDVTLKHALVESLNNASVWVLQQIGVSAGFEMIQRLGISTLTAEDRNLALALGGITRGVSPLELAASYVPFANGGVRYTPFAVREVQTANGQVLYRNRPRARRVLAPEIAYFVTDMLEDAVRRGTGTAADIGRPQAGKTGTTNDSASAWFVGYTPDLVAAVYIGHDDRSPLAGGGGTLAAPVWGRFAATALRNVTPRAFPQPPSVVDGIPIDIFTGLRADANCAFQEIDSFTRGREPWQYSPCTWGIAQRGGPNLPQPPGSQSPAPETPGEALPLPRLEEPFAPTPFDPAPLSPASLNPASSDQE